MKVVIMAGGRGTRISELFPDIPKPLIPIDGIPVLEREVCSLASQGFRDIILTVSYLHEKIEEHFGDGSKWGVKIEYFVENTPLGNAGALFKLNLKEDFLLLNADAMFDVDFNRFVDFWFPVARCIDYCDVCWCSQCDSLFGPHYWYCDRNLYWRGRFSF